MGYISPRGHFFAALFFISVLSACSSSPSTATSNPATPNTVTVYPPTGSPGTPGTVVLPDGSQLNVSGSQTAGLQEAVTYASQNGWGIAVYGRGLQTNSQGIALNIPPSAGGYYNLSAPLVFPAMQGKTIAIYDATLNFDGNVTSAGLVFDSCMMCTFTLTGQVVISSAASGISFRPTSLLPLDGPKDGITGIVDSTFDIQTVAMTNTVSNAGVIFDTTGASIENSTFTLHEIDGGSQGMVVYNGSPATYPFSLNTITAQHIHGQSGAGVQLGTSAANESLITQNDFTLFISSQNGSTGLDLWGTLNNITATLSSNEGVPAVGVILESGDNGNSLTLDSSIAQTPIQCASGTATANVFDGSTTCPQ